MPHEAMAGVYLGDRRVGTLCYQSGNTWFDYEDTAADRVVLEDDPVRSPSCQPTSPAPTTTRSASPSRGPAEILDAL